ncbi:MAG: hypothetical protein QUV07_11530 [Cyanobium sp. CZS 25K]|jgi:hypothetical protein|nr:hypothetical protein [Cyanobium sp. CZS25K]
MTPLFQAAFLSLALLFTSGALACEKHLNGHQNSTDSNAQDFGR